VVVIDEIGRDQFLGDIGAALRQTCESQRR
jgi:hypothetical protein